METKFDFKTPIERTSTQLARMVLEKISDNLDAFVYEDYGDDKEREREITEKSTDVCISVMSEMSKTDIPADYSTLCIDKLIAALTGMKAYIGGTIRQQENEILARYIGSKSPVTNTYAADVATMGEIMLAVNKVRQETGNNMDDYFIKSNPELSTDVASPENVV